LRINLRWPFSFGGCFAGGSADHCHRAPVPVPPWLFLLTRNVLLSATMATERGSRKAGKEGEKVKGIFEDPAGSGVWWIVYSSVRKKEIPGKATDHRKEPGSRWSADSKISPCDTIAEVVRYICAFHAAPTGYRDHNRDSVCMASGAGNS
jgi:hypothetical protein